MNKKELEKEYNKIRGEQISTEIPDDMYPSMRDVLSAGLNYITAKVLKRIIEDNKK